MTQPHEGPIQEQIATLVRMAEAETGYDRTRLLDKVNSLVESDAGHLLARAELVRAFTEAHAIGVPLGDWLDSIEPGERWWSSPWAVVSAAATAVSALVAIAWVIG